MCMRMRVCYSLFMFVFMCAMPCREAYRDGYNAQTLPYTGRVCAWETCEITC